MPDVSSPHSRVRDPLKTAREEINNNHAPEDVHHNPETCPACEALRELDGLIEQLETLDDALRDILDIVEGWTPKMDPDVRIGRIGAYATEALKAAKRVSNPAKEPSA